MTEIKLVDLPSDEDKKETKKTDAAKAADAGCKTDAAKKGEANKSGESKDAAKIAKKTEGAQAAPPTKPLFKKNHPIDQGQDDGLLKLLIADSVCDSLGRMHRMTVHIMGNARIENVTHAVTTDCINVRGFSIIIIHVGTNNLATDDVKYMICKYQQLLNAIKMRNRRAIIAISSVLPRPVDFARSRGKSTMLNKELTHLCMLPALTHSLFFIPSFRPFIKDAQPVNEYYGKDGIHLSHDGVQVLRKFFMNAFRLIVKTKLSVGSYAHRY